MRFYHAAVLSAQADIIKYSINTLSLKNLTSLRRYCNIGVGVYYYNIKI